MKIISWNVNGIRAVEKKGFLAYIRAESPDMFCIQETKAAPNQLSPELLAPLGASGAAYKSYWASAAKRGYSGTAIYSLTEPLSVGFLGDERFDSEGRVLQAEYPDFTLISAYFPNSQEEGARLPYKLDFCEAMIEHCRSLCAQKKNVILAGDYNIAHKKIDLARPKENERNAGYLPEERAWMDEWTASGFCDTFRRFHPEEEGRYTWWSFRSGARARNIGWRIDYFCVNEAFMPRVAGAAITPAVTGSDHCPIELRLT